MSRWVSAGCLAALLLSCFGGVLLQDEVFSYRDSAEYHEPLARLARQEWLAGRLPLWDPTVNGGVPLLGNPAAAVLYPGKVLELLPPPWGGRVFVVVHVMLAFLAARAMLRGWDVSREGADLGAAAYAFGAPVLFQYSNVIYLVGAAWLPLGFRAVDRVVRLKRRAAVAELAAVLALIALGGDPESAYLLVVCGFVYALGLACRTAPDGLRVPGGRLGSLAGLVAGLTVWVGLTLLSARVVKSSRWWFPLAAEGPYPAWYQAGLAACWGAAGVWWVRRAKRGGGEAPLVGLAGAAVLALATGALAFWPALELSRLSVRSAEGSAHAIYPFSVEPYRAVEWLWPGFFGPFRRAERQWLHLMPPRHVVQTWAPSLYLGGLTILLAAAGRATRPERALAGLADGRRRGQRSWGARRIREPRLVGPRVARGRGVARRARRRPRRRGAGRRRRQRRRRRGLLAARRGLARVRRIPISGKIAHVHVSGPRGPGRRGVGPCAGGANPRLETRRRRAHSLDRWNNYGFAHARAGPRVAGVGG
ncbi:MAG: hypothetical protein U0835_13345 [Isosphaeraceae bacterium]